VSDKMDENKLDSRLINTFYLVFGTIVYLTAICFFFFTLKRIFDGSVAGLEILFALTLLPLLAIFVIVWGYGMKLKMPGLELEYYPVEKAMKPATLIKESTTATEARDIMEKFKTDFLSILDQDGIFKGIVTKSDLINIFEKGKITTKVKNFMTNREKVIKVSEREDLKNVMKKIGQSKHSRLPVLDNNNKILGVIDSVDINDMISKLL
jgi:CBS domain-containing protein